MSSLPPSPERLERISQEIARAQQPLHAYACMLLGSARDAADVLQEANLVLWRKADEFDATRPFLPWAYRIVYLQVLAHRERQSRDRLRFSGAVLEQIAAAVAQRSDDLEQWTRALEDCVARLPARQRAIIERRYQQGSPLAAIASDEGVSENAVKTLLYRARLALTRCVKFAVGEEAP